MCRSHECKPYKDSGIRAVHWIISGALNAAVRWGWLGINPAEQAKKPSLPAAKPKPPSTEEAARLVLDAFARDPNWGTFLWIAMTTGARRGELCALRWTDLDLDKAVLQIKRAIGKDADGSWIEKDTKTHQQRRVALDIESIAVLREHRARADTTAAQLDTTVDPSGFVFAIAPDHSAFLDPGTTTHRYERMAKRLRINSTLHKLRHYSATELLAAGVDVRTVAGRLGHDDGGATTLRNYAAWLAEADQRAAPALAGRMPARPSAQPTPDVGSVPEAVDDDAPPTGPYRQIARDLQGAITARILAPGDELPTVKELANRYSVAPSTAHRAIAQLVEQGLVEVSRGRARLSLRCERPGRSHPREV